MIYKLTTEKQKRLAKEAYNALYLLKQEEAFQDAPWLEREILTLHALIWSSTGITKAGKPSKNTKGLLRGKYPIEGCPGGDGDS